MKIIRTANLVVLETYLRGGQINGSGNQSEGFHCLNPYHGDEEWLKSFEKTKELIVILISDEGEEKFEYYNEIYRFREPNEKNLTKLAHIIFNRNQEIYKEIEE